MAKTDNRKYVDRGRGLVMRRDPAWDADLGRANRRKNGAPFLYADAMMMQAAAVRTACRTAYRRPGGMIQGMLGAGSAPDYTTIYRRIRRLDVDIGGGYVTVRGGGMTLIADATGLKQHNRGEWIHHKRRVRRGFARVHLLVDADTRKIVSVVVTDESAGDGPQLKELLERAQERSGRPDAARGDPGTARRNMPASGIPPLARLGGGAPPPAPGTALLADAAYGSRANVAECGRRGTGPLMRLKINSEAKGRGSGDAWGQLARRQLGGGPEEKIGGLTREERLENLRYRRSTVGYGARWLAGTVISALKRMFGEDVMALKWPNVVREVMLRVALYNRWVEEAMAA